MSPWKDVAVDVWAHMYGFVQCLGAICWAGVLLMVEYFDLLFPKRKSFRGETVLITGTKSRRLLCCGRVGRDVNLVGQCL